MRFGERVFETTMTEGTGSYSLAGAASGHQTFLDGIGAGTLVAYIATDGSDWEVGYGTLSSGPATLTREAIFDSSNAGAAVNWTAGTRNIYCAPVAAVLTSALKTHKGSARPDWLPAGGLWVDDTTTPWLLKLYDGAASISLGRVDATNDRFISEGIKGTDIASAGSIDIGAATGDFVHITGTTTITALGTVAAGVERTLVFDGILTLTHNASSLILFDGVNITTAAGMVVRVRSEGSGNWRQVGGYRAISSAVLPAATTSAQGAVELADTTETQALTDSARAVTPAGLAAVGFMELIGIVATSSGSTQALTDIPPCRALFVVFAGVSASGTATMRIAISDDNGASYGTARDVGVPSVSSGFNNAIQAWISGTGVAATSKRIHYIAGAEGAGGNAALGTEVESTETGITNALRFSPSAGSFDAGNIYVYGWR